MHRRTFMQRAGLGAVGTAMAVGGGLLTSRRASARVVGANERVRLAVLGTNSRGAELAKVFAGLADCQVTHVCDPDDRAAARGVKEVEGAGGESPVVMRDFRKALEDPALTGVVIAMPDHWHAAATLMALEAGKHVYVEKPCGHNPAEGEMVVAGQRRHAGLVVQMGNQRRSAPNLQEAVKLIREGVIGRAYHAKTWYCRKRESIGLGKPVEVPGHLDWELWQGPAPRRPYMDNVVHYNWHWFWHWGTGEVCNNGTHEIDVARWALGVDYAERVVSSGARHAYDDDWEFWDIQTVGMEFPGKKSIVWEGHSVNAVRQHGLDRGCMVYGEKGTVLLDANAYTVRDHDGKVIASAGVAETGATDTRAPTVDVTRAHCLNFVESVRGVARPNAEILGAHKSVLLCHLGNIAQRTGVALVCDAETGKLEGGLAAGSEASGLWGREYEAGWMPVV